MFVTLWIPQLGANIQFFCDVNLLAVVIQVSITGIYYGWWTSIGSKYSKYMDCFKQFHRLDTSGTYRYVTK